LGCHKLQYYNYLTSEKTTLNRRSKTHDEIYGDGNYIDLGERGYDTRLGRLNLSPDPLAHKFVGQSPYAYAANNPIRLIDVNGLGPGDPVGQGYYNAFSTTREIGFFLRHPIYATKIGLVTHGSTNISTNATRFSINTNLPENKAMEGSHRNAYRHVLWQSTITTQFGASIARQVGNAHESNPSADLTQRSGFKTLANADQTIDLLNNQIGIQIGTANPNASMQELAIKTLDYFKTNGLYTATKQEDGTYSITQTKLTEEQYKAAMQTIKTTNNNGYTPPQQQAADEEALKQQQLIESTNPTY
jgi:RHS repeat-associated protein